MSKIQKLCGIDYGSKLAGTTVIASYDVTNQKVELSQSKKKQDADKFLREKIIDFQPASIFIDAPLSLPMVYQNPSVDSPDFFYRKGDRALKAMSPLFLGGLTARAMQLKHELVSFQWFEAYPSAQAQRLNLKELGYKKEVKNIEQVWQTLIQNFPELTITPKPINWHQLDALLALVTGIRFCQDDIITYGKEEEGLIYV